MICPRCHEEDCKNPDGKICSDNIIVQLQAALTASTQRVEELTIKLQQAEASLSQIWTDELGKKWTRPTAQDYGLLCKSHAYWKDTGTKATATVEEMRGRLDVTNRAIVAMLATNIPVGLRLTLDALLKYNEAALAQHPAGGGWQV